MSTNPTATVYLWTNNTSLKEYVEKYLKQLGLKIETGKKETDYLLYLYDQTESGDDADIKLPDLLDSLKKKIGKICLVLINDSQSKTDVFEKNALEVESYLSALTLDLRLVQTLDLYSSQTSPDLSPFQRLVYDAARENKIVVTSTGDNLYFPTALADLCDLISKSLFISHTAGETFTGISQEIADLDLAYLLKKSLEKKDQNFNLDLTKSAKTQIRTYSQDSIHTQALLNWLPKVELADEIDQIIAQSLADEKPSENLIKTNEPIAQEVTLAKLERQIPKKPNLLTSLWKKTKNKIPKKEQPEEDLHQTEKRGFTRLLVFTVLAIALLALTPFLMTAGGLYLSASSTYRAYQALRLGEDQRSRELLNQAKFWQGVTQSSFQRTVFLANLLSPSQVTRSNNFIAILGHGQSVIESGLDSYALGNQLYLGLLGKQTLDSHANIVALRVNLVALSEKLSQIQLLVNQIDLPFGYAQKIKTSDLNDQIQLLKTQIGLGIPLLDLVDEISSDQTLQRYLVVIQDPNELRASGGFLTSNLLITLDQGKIINLVTDSSLSIDRLIEGKIEPPPVIKQLLGQSRWLYHDSNNDADFSISASQIAWFYQRFKNMDLNGVIGLNLSFYESLLSEIGEVKLTDGSVVSVDNLNQLASNPTSGKGLDVVTALTGDLGQKLSRGEIKFALLTRALLKTIAYNEINLWFLKPSLQSLTQGSRLAGEIRPQPCHPQLATLGCRADFIHLNESNFSVNKLNYYLKRAQNLQVNLSPGGELDYTLTYDYSYPVPAPTNLAQEYKAYYQLYLPPVVRNLSISLDNQHITGALIKQTTLPQGVKLEFSGEQVINQPHRLVIKFTSVNLLDLKKPQVPFSFTYLKQPGTLKDNFSVKVTYPPTLQPKIMTLPFKQSGANELTLQVTPTSHQNLGILFKNTSL